MERSEQLRVPAGFPVGSLFGRGGRHLREVQARTGARIAIKEQGREAYIAISGSAAAVQAAARFYRSRFQEHEAAGFAQPVVPSEATVLLHPPLAGGARFLAMPPGDEVAAAVDTRKQLYTLTPAPGATLAAAAAAAARRAEEAAALVRNLSAARLEGLIGDRELLARLPGPEETSQLDAQTAAEARRARLRAEARLAGRPEPAAAPWDVEGLAEPSELLDPELLAEPVLPPGWCMLHGVPVPPQEFAAATAEERRRRAAGAGAGAGAAAAGAGVGTGAAAGAEPRALVAAPLPALVSAEAAGGAAIMRLTQAIERALGGSQAAQYDSLRLRFNLGRQFFCISAAQHARSPSAFGVLPLDAMQSLSIGRSGDLQAFFSNAVPLGRVPSLEARLQQLGFRRTSTKRSVTVHFYRRDTFKADAVKLVPTGGGALEPVKVRSGNFKLFFLAEAGGDAHPDTRLKLLASRVHSEGGTDAGCKGAEASGSQHAATVVTPEQELLAVAGACRLEGPRVVLPPTYHSSFMVDRVRFKDKEMWERSAQLPIGAGATATGSSASSGTGSTAPACTLLVAVCSVRDDQGRHHVEVGGSCTELNRLLKQRLDAVHAELAGTTRTAGAATGAGRTADSSAAATAGAAGSRADAAAGTAGTAAQCVPYIRAMRELCQQLRSSL